MRIGFWVKHFLFVASLAFLILLGVELVKGHGWKGAIQFASLWSLISASVFIGTRIYYSSRGVGCPLCDDLAK